MKRISLVILFGTLLCACDEKKDVKRQISFSEQLEIADTIQAPVALKVIDKVSTKCSTPGGYYLLNVITVVDGADTLYIASSLEGGIAIQRK